VRKGASTEPSGVAVCSVSASATNLPDLLRRRIPMMADAGAVEYRRQRMMVCHLKSQALEVWPSVD
jgi:hypothetical protein